VAGEADTPGAQRVIRIVYEVDGVERAVTDQRSLEQALTRTGNALGDTTFKVTRAEQSLRAMNDVATRSEQVQQRLHQQMQSLAGGLGQLSHVFGNDSELGSLLGRMSRFASLGMQLGSVFGPQGQVVGGIVGSAIPALNALIARIDGLDDQARRSTERLRDMTDAIFAQARAARQAAADIARWSAALSQRQALEQANRIRQGDYRDERDMLLGAEMYREEGRRAAFRRAAGQQPDRSGAPVSFLMSPEEQEALREGGIDALYEMYAQNLERLAESRGSGEGGTPGSRGDTGSQPRRGGGRGRREDPLDELMRRSVGGNDAVGWAARLELQDVSGRPSDFEIEVAGLGRRRSMMATFEEGRAQLQAIEKIKEAQVRAHEEQMERIREQVAAWEQAGQKISGSLYSAFVDSVSGAEQFDAAMVKSFKNIAIEFGGQMVAEGVGALLTAVGASALRPDVAATKALEGAGKIALGIGLGAAGAAVPVPSGASAPSQSSTPRLGPESSGSAVGGSVIVNMNAPAVVTGSVAQVGRSISRTVTQAQLRYGGA
jgi:hypothetical protein